MNPLCRVVLVEPLIPENTGNVARTCVSTNAEMHLIHPLGFEVNESRVRRAGLDYWEHLRWFEHRSVQDWQSRVADPTRVFLIETNGQKSLFEAQFQPGDWLLFGKETTGLDPHILRQYEDRTHYIPMIGPTRSLNLSNSVAVCVFELLRQLQKT